MNALNFGNEFEEFKENARDYLCKNIAPEGMTPDAALVPPFLVPREFLRLAEKVSCHSNPKRWDILYRMLWRLAHGQRKLLEIEIDEDTRALLKMEKEVTRDCFRMRRGLQFHHSDSSDAEEVAWFEPDHRILRLVAPHFARKYPTKKWLILTPFERARWDGHKLTISAGGAQSPSDKQLTFEACLDRQGKPQKSQFF